MYGKGGNRREGDESDMEDNIQSLSQELRTKFNKSPQEMDSRECVHDTYPFYSSGSYFVRRSRVKEGFEVSSKFICNLDNKRRRTEDKKCHVKTFMFVQQKSCNASPMGGDVWWFLDTAF